MTRIRSDVNQMVQDVYHQAGRWRVLQELPRRIPSSRNIAIAQGAAYLLSGLWSLVSFRSFERFTGRRPQRWLARTTGMLIAVSGGVLLNTAIRRRRIPKEIGWLAAGQAGILGATSLVTTIGRRTPMTYLAEAAFEIPIALGWLAHLTAPDHARTVFSRAV